MRRREENLDPAIEEEMRLWLRIVSKMALVLKVTQKNEDNSGVDIVLATTSHTLSLITGLPPAGV
jgi:hypothetical protein